MRIAALIQFGLLSSLVACSPAPRSTRYFDAHPGDIDGVLSACAAGHRRGGECDTAGLADAHRKADARIKLYKQNF